MNQKSLIFAATLALLVLTGVFWYGQKREVVVNQPVTTDPVSDITSEPTEAVASTPRFLENAPDIQSLLNARYPIKNLDTTNWEIYQSPSGFSVKMPEGTRVEVLDEGEYTITYFKSKGSTHTVHIYSYEGDVNQQNLHEQIKTDLILTGTDRFSTDRQVQCTTKAMCFFSPMYADKTETDPNPPLMMLHTDVISKDSYPFFYFVSIGNYYPPLTQGEINLYAAILKTFQFTQ